MSFCVGGRMSLFLLIQRTSHFMPSSTPSLTKHKMLLINC